MTELMRKMWLDDEGQDLIEYALMLALILLLAVVTIQGIGSRVNTIFSQTNSAIQAP